MQKYELMLVVQGQIPEDLAKEVINKVKNIIADLGTKDTEEDFWGRRKLAYKIGSQEHGYYDLLKFSIDPENIKKLENEIKLINEVIRYLMIKKPERKLEKPRKKLEVKEEKEKLQKIEKEEKEAIEEKVEKKEEEIAKKAEIKEAKEEKIEEEVKEEKKEEKPTEIQEDERLKELDKKIDEILKE